MAAAGLIVAAPRSGAGKTTVTLGLLAALRRAGVAVRAAKSGPDYIDPGFHAAATGAAGVNLDSWAMAPALLDTLVAQAATAELLVIEAAMGLFDGVAAPPGRSGAAADLAARFGLPVLLVLDVSGQAQSAAAVARGFAAHREGVRVAGVVLNRVGSERHRAVVAGAMAAAGLPVLGALPRDAAIALPERHLGLVQAAEHSALAAILDRLADAAARHLDLDAIRRLASPPPLVGGGWGEGCAQHAISRGATPHPGPPPQGGREKGAIRVGIAGVLLTPPGQRIALARDAAFGFAYPHLLAGWRAAGAEIVPFSPLADEPPPSGCDACWLPGGYPELHAGRIAAAARFRAGLVRFAETRPVHGECGGHMVLGRALQDADGVWHPMAGLLGHATSFARRRLTLGYRRARLLAPGPLGPGGAWLRGHEFHYATLAEAGDDAPFAEIEDAAGAALGLGGGRRGCVTGSFFHVIAPE